MCVPGAAAGQELSVCRILFVDCCLLCRRRSENHDSAHTHGRMNLPEPSGSSKGRTGSSCSAIFPTPQLARGSSKRLWLGAVLKPISLESRFLCRNWNSHARLAKCSAGRSWAAVAVFRAFIGATIARVLFFGSAGSWSMVSAMERNTIETDCQMNIPFRSNPCLLLRAFFLLSSGMNSSHSSSLSTTSSGSMVPLPLPVCLMLGSAM